MNNISVFDFNGQEVRFVGTPEKPEWVAQDVCNVLDIANSRDALSRLEDYQKGSVAITDTSSSSRKTITVQTVTEAGLYALIFTSRKPVAKEFQRWVFEDVLPSIRKTGQYSIPKPGPANIIWFDRLLLFQKHSKIPPGYFSIFGEVTHTLISDFEAAGYVLPNHTGIDIAVGRRWSNYTKDKYPNIEDLRKTYDHHYPDQRGIRPAFIYAICLLSDFREWLEFTYKVTHLLKYLEERDEQSALVILKDMMKEYP